MLLYCKEMMPDVGCFSDIRYMLVFSNSFWPIADANTDICTYFFPPNGRENQVSPATELTYYAYSYRDGSLAAAK